jgi:hypothetical protein
LGVRLPLPAPIAIVKSSLFSLRSYRAAAPCLDPRLPRPAVNAALLSGL